jgi:lipopolysaccharide transport system ATP-binding protein
MYTRLAFAVAAHLDPEVLIVDEVLAVGDATFQKKCLGKMSDVARLGRTVLFVSHNMAAVGSLCNRAILLHEGRVAEEGAPSHIISKYLSSGSMSRAEVIWDREAVPLGNAMVSLHAVRVRDVRGNVTSIINSHEAIDVEIDYINLRAGTKLGTTILLYNQEGVVVFSSLSNNDPQWHGRSRPKGMFRSTVRIHSHLLPEGRFVVTVLLWSDNYTFAHREDNTVEFEVHDTGEARGDYLGGWVGVVRPRLQWRAEFIDEEERASLNRNVTQHESANSPHAASLATFGAAE